MECQWARKGLRIGTCMVNFASISFITSENALGVFIRHYLFRISLNNIRHDYLCASSRQMKHARLRFLIAIAVCYRFVVLLQGTIPDSGASGAGKFIGWNQQDCNQPNMMNCD